MDLEDKAQSPSGFVCLCLNGYFILLCTFHISRPFYPTARRHVPTNHYIRRIPAESQTDILSQSSISSSSVLTRSNQPQGDSWVSPFLTAGWGSLEYKSFHPSVWCMMSIPLVFRDETPQNTQTISGRLLGSSTHRLWAKIRPKQRDFPH